MEQGERFEQFLREFEPRRPRALPAMVESQWEWRRLAAAVAVLVALSSSTWFAVHQKVSRQIEPVSNTVAGSVHTKSTARFSALQLRQIATEDPARFDAALIEESRRVLPDFRASKSTLRVLAKE